MGTIATPGRSVALSAALVVLTLSCGSQTAPVGTAPTRSVAPSVSPSTATAPASTPAIPASPSASTTPSSAAGALPLFLRGPVVTRLPTTRRVIALTFDGGAGAQGATSVLRTLGNAKVPATFFLTGEFVRRNPAVVHAITAARGVIGTHTMSHPHLPGLASGAVVAEVADGAGQLRQVAGIDPRPWFRFPYGDADARTLALVHRLGYGAIGWTIDTLGWQGHDSGSATDVVTRVRAGLVPGAIVLMHLGANPDDATTYDADALALVIAAARAAGYTFVDLSSFGP